uniref:Histone H4 n=1 Tax=Angiostrongylus cantonensis TaxID=6313 RepID=A0A0K0D368_ANGCA
MSGRENGGNGQIKGGSKCHREVLGNSMRGITKPAYGEIRKALRVSLNNVIRDAVIYRVKARRESVTAVDYAPERRGLTLGCFGE